MKVHLTAKFKVPNLLHCRLQRLPLMSTINTEGVLATDENALNTTCLTDKWYWVSDGESQDERKASSTHHWTNIGMTVHL